MRIETVQGKDETVYMAKMGFAEIEMIHGVLREAFRGIPKVVETGPFRNRMRDMIEKTGQIISERRARKSGYRVEDYLSPEALRGQLETQD